ncbi:hypothetical protein BBK82_03490 [Lentzea guizhouensis]|uniref:Uncharacterized protein n=1 Tax=Lentzea guizhouensis TaxID=1586287 RepID=A0A1B2HC43_9PSEU|nr:hypothetical protein [Lentzea guizhouensis]ANZ35279.1 hypothetical protein BBK82_03490 [Lentzea guizhouensis]
MTNKWELVDALPGELDETKAVVWRQVEQENVLQLGGRHLVFGDEVWQQRDDGRWQRSAMTLADLVPPGWERV